MNSCENLFNFSFVVGLISFIKKFFFCYRQSLLSLCIGGQGVVGLFDLFSYIRVIQNFSSYIFINNSRLCTPSFSFTTQLDEV